MELEKNLVEDFSGICFGRENLIGGRRREGLKLGRRGNNKGRV